MGDDGTSVLIELPEIAPTWGMEIMYSLKDSDGNRIQGRIHNTVHKLGER